MEKHGKAQEVYSSGLSTAPSVCRSSLIVLQISLQLLRPIQISFHPKVSLYNLAKLIERYGKRAPRKGDYTTWENILHQGSDLIQQLKC